MDVASLMRQAALTNSTRQAIVFEGRSLTFAQAWDRGVRLANALIDMGVRPGDRVAAVEDNSLTAMDFFLGTAIAGAVRVPLYARNARASHFAMLRNTDCKVLFAESHYADSVEGAVKELEALDHLVIRDDGYEAWLAVQSDVDPMVRVESDAWYIIRHSSGTSGQPKGVGYTQSGWLACSRNWYTRLPTPDWDTVIAHAAPISHGAGYMVIPVWLAGGTNVLIRKFEVDETLDMMERGGVTHMFLAPSMVLALSRDPSVASRSFPHLSCILTGGGPITDATINASRQAFGDVLYQVYGQTEATPLTLMSPKEWFSDIEGSSPMRSAGRAMPYCELQIRDVENGAVMEAGQVGEVYTRVEAQMQSYWNNPERTKGTVIDGWIRTGDIGRIDANGFLYVLDRSDDMIVSGGLNIWPAELETVIADHPQVIEAAVFGIPHDKWGETPMAVCQIAEGDTVDADEIVALVTDRMGSYMKPTLVEFRTEPLPKTLVGKLSRRTLRDPHWEGRGRGA